MTFEELDLDPRLLQATRDAGFVACTPVQEQTFAYSLVGSDVAVQSQTGTGKTAAFLLTIFQLFLEQRSLDGKIALVIAPTRELADQIEQDAHQLGKHVDFPIASFYGGVSYEKQERALANGVRLAIGTPGRLLDFSEQRKLDLGSVGILVIDEADRMFDMGFIPDLRRLIRRMPGRDQRITMLYSATLTTRVKTLAFDHMKDPAEITIAPERVTVDEITQELYHVARDRKLSLLLGILAHGQPRNALIFTNMKQTAYEVAMRMQRNGMECEYIVGDRPQRQRQRLIDSLKDGTLRYLVATDVAARGLHVEDLELVVNYDLPEYSENYVHRIGRTARAGRTGKAVSLACEEHVYALAGIEEFIRAPIAVVTAPAELFADDTSAGMRVEHYLHGRGRDERRDRPRPARSAPRAVPVSAAGTGNGRERAGTPTVAAGTPAGTGTARPAAAARSPALDANGSGGNGVREASNGNTGTGGTGRRRRRRRGGRGRGGGAVAAPTLSTSAERPDRPAPGDGAPAATEARQNSAGGDAGDATPPRQPGLNRHSRAADGPGSLDERLARYREKYGEEFRLVEPAVPATPHPAPPLRPLRPLRPLPPLRPAHGPLHPPRPTKHRAACGSCCAACWGGRSRSDCDRPRTRRNPPSAPVRWGRGSSRAGRLPPASAGR